MRPPNLGLSPAMGGPPPPHGLDPLLHYGGLYGVRERMELARYDDKIFNPICF